MRSPQFVLTPLALASVLVCGVLLPLCSDAQESAPPNQQGREHQEGQPRALPDVTVTSEQARAGEEPGAYSGGQVATGGRMGMLGNKDFMETPFNTISYTDNYVQNIQAQDLGRVISLTDPGVFTSGSSGMINDTFSIRGFSLSQGDVGFGGLYGVVPFYRVTPELAERVEVLKGPSALLNGMPPGGSVGGSVNLVPKRAGDKPLARLTTTYASDAQFGTHVDLGQRFGENRQFGIRFNGVYRDGDTAVSGQSKQATLAALGMDWRTERVRLSADLYSSRDHVDGLNRGVSLAPGLGVPRPPSSDTLLAPGWTFSNTKDHAVILRGEVDITRDTMAYATWGQSKTNFNALATSTNTVINAAGDYQNNFAHQRMIYDRNSAEVGARSRFLTGGVGHEMAVTASYYQHDYQFGFMQNMLSKPWLTNIYHPQWGPALDRGFSSASLPKTGAVRMTSYGVADTLSFLQNQLQVTVGLRRQSIVSDTFNGATGVRTARYDASATTPAAAVMYRATRNLAVYGNYVEGLSQGSTAPATAANAGAVFPPYKTKQREIGLKMDMGSFASTLSLFQIERPSAYTDPVTNVFSFGGEQRNRGVELSTFGEPVRGLRVMGGVSYLQPKLTRTAGGINQGKLATATPKWQGKLGVEHDLAAVPGLTLTAHANAASSQYINANNSLWVPGRTVFDLGARYSTSLAGRPLVLRAAVQNVTNKAYWASTLGSGLGAPRTLLLSASIDL